MIYHYLPTKEEMMSDTYSRIPGSSAIYSYRDGQLHQIATANTVHIADRIVRLLNKDEKERRK